MSISLPKPILPGHTLTVIIRDDGPMVHSNDCPVYRSVRIELTDEQRTALSLQATFCTEGKWYHESVSNCFIEPMSAADERSR